MVGSSPGGSSAIAMTTLSFLPCASTGSGVASSAAAATTIDSFLNITELPGLHVIDLDGFCKRLPLRRRPWQRHDGLGLVAGGEMRGADPAERRRDLAAMRIRQRTARGIGTPGRSSR